MRAISFLFIFLTACATDPIIYKDLLDTTTYPTRVECVYSGWCSGFSIVNGRVILSEGYNQYCQGLVPAEITLERYLYTYESGRVETVTKRRKTKLRGQCG